MPVTLENRLRQMQVFNLDHASYCHMKCACSQVSAVVMDENPRNGERAPRRITKKVPASLTLLALQRKSGLPTAVLDVPDIKAAIQRGHLRVVEQTADASQAEPVPAKEAK